MTNHDKGGDEEHEKQTEPDEVTEEEDETKETKHEDEVMEA